MERLLTHDEAGPGGKPAQARLGQRSRDLAERAANMNDCRGPGAARRPRDLARECPVELDRPQPVAPVAQTALDSTRQRARRQQAMQDRRAGRADDPVGSNPLAAADPHACGPPLPYLDRLDGGIAAKLALG